MNRFRLRDVPLDSVKTDLAAAIVVREQVGVADAHVGACVAAAGWTDVIVLTSDPGDMTRVCAPVPVRAVHLTARPQQPGPANNVLT